MGCFVSNLNELPIHTFGLVGWMLLQQCAAACFHYKDLKSYRLMNAPSDIFRLLEYNGADDPPKAPLKI